MQKNTNKDLKRIDAKIKKAKETLSGLERDRKELIKAFQDTCKHSKDSIFKTEWTSNTPTILVCKECGYSEEGGYYKLYPSGNDDISAKEGKKLVLGTTLPYHIIERLRSPERYITKDKFGVSLSIEDWKCKECEGPYKCSRHYRDEYD